MRTQDSYKTTTQILRRKVYDPLQRFLHGMLVLSVLTLFVTGMSAPLFSEGLIRHQVWSWHIKSGYILILVLGTRFIWSFVGPRFSRIEDYFKYFKKSSINSPFAPSFGHDSKAALLYLVLFGVLTSLIGSGLFLSAIEQNKGPLRNYFFDEMSLKELFSNLHWFGVWFVAGFFILHLGALIVHQYKNQLPMFSSMITGFQYRRKNEKNKDRN